LDFLGVDSTVSVGIDAPERALHGFGKLGLDDETIFILVSGFEVVGEGGELAESSGGCCT
jgi:hypothetical protein